MKNHFLAFVVAASVFALPATADTINFEQLASGDLGSGAITVDGVTFDGSPNLFNTSSGHFNGAGGSICSFNPSGFNCSNDMKVKFNGRVKRLSLATSGHDAGDTVTISVFRRKNNLGSVTVSADQAINLRGFGRVTKLVFDDSSTGAGYAYGAFKFKRLSGPNRDAARPARD